MPLSPQQLAEAYAAFLQRSKEQQPCEQVGESSSLSIPECVVQSLWADGLFPRQGRTVGHGGVRILSPGRWNRNAGPDFLRAEIELGRQRFIGDIEIDVDPQDWERDGSGDNPAYDQVVLHVVLKAPSAGWFTRTSQHKEVPVLWLSPSLVQSVVGRTSRSERGTGEEQPCPLRQMDERILETLLQAAAAYRMENKRARFRRQSELHGEQQAWYQGWAEALGYRANKWPMKMLAQRAPLSDLGSQAEALLFGIAGFLTPTLPERTSEEARAYHRQLWDAWWLLREQWELAPARSLPWSPNPVRPLNHPQRRIAALAVTISQWDRILPLFRVSAISDLARLLSSLRHPYWSTHCTLSSASLSAPAALAGKERVDDFLVNVLYAQDSRPGVWQNYLRHKAVRRGNVFLPKAKQLVDERSPLLKNLRYSYIQQALIQIDNDFSMENGLYSALLNRWDIPKGF